MASGNSVLLQLQVVTSLAKLEKPETVLDRKMRKTENQRLNWRKLPNRAKHQNWKTVESKNKNQKLANSAKPKIPTFPPAQSFLEHNANPKLLYDKENNLLCALTMLKIWV